MAGLCVLAALYIVGDSLLQIVRAYSSLPYQDQWETVLDYQVLRHGNMNLALLFSQHNEHRIAIPRLIFFADYALAGGTNWLDILVVNLIQATHIVLLLSLLRGGWRDLRTWIVGAAVIALLTSLGQWQNLTWGFQTQFVGVFALATGAFMLLSRAARRDLGQRSVLIAFGAAIFLLLMATFTMANGLVASAIAVVLCLALGAPWWMPAALTLFTLISGLFYFHGYHAISTNSTAAYALAHPLDYIAYCLSYLGNPIGDLRLWHPASRFAPLVHALPAVLGAAGVVAGAAAIILTALRRGADRVQAVLVAIILLVFASAAMTALGRLSFGMAYSSRYRTPTCLFWAAQIIFWYRCTPRLPAAWARTMMAAAAACVLITLLWVQHTTKPDLILETMGEHLAEDALLTGVTDITAVGAVYPRPGEVLARSDILREYHKSIFTEPRAAWLGRPVTAVATVAPDACIGAVDAVTRAASADVDAIRAEGWAWDSKGRRAPVHILLTDDQLKVIGFATTGVPRGDVVKALHASGAAESGWRGVARSREGRVHAFAELPGREVCEVGSVPAANIPPGMAPRPAPPPRAGTLIAAPVAADATWTLGGASPATGPAPPGAYASWSGNDVNLGVISFGPFQTEGDSLVFELITGPDVTGQSIVLTDAQTGKVLAVLNPIKYEAWTWLQVQLPPTAKGRPVLLQGLDRGAGWGQWIGMTGPYAPAGAAP